MSEIHPEFGKLMTAEEYAREWQENSSQFERLGYYVMPLQRLGGPRTVMEIGSGSGRSTLSLARKGHTIVAVEINETAAQSAHEYLSGNGIETRLTRTFPVGDQDLPRVTIVVGDANAAGELTNQGGMKFDAVLCWFVGAQLDVIADFHGKPTTELTSEDVRNYRLAMQGRCYDIGRRVLRRGGIVQVVDRMRLVSWQDKDAARENLARMQADIAGPDYVLSKATTFLAKISGVFEGSGIQYLKDSPEAQVRVVTSVIATLGAR
jgi:SAM-dependent methyltransferase